jgi:YjbE family integral membrane protein
MPFDSALNWIFIPIEIFLIDLALGGDNALVIVSACRRLPQHSFRRAVLFGTIAAAELRLMLVLMGGTLLETPYLKTMCAVLLLIVAVNLTIRAESIAGEDDERFVHSTEREGARPKSLWSTIALIALADAIMGLDNVVALAAVAHGSMFYLVLGLAISIPMLVYGGAFLAKLLRSHPLLTTCAGAVLGWISGDLAVGDPAIAQWIDQQAPALSAIIPILCAVFVLAEGRIAARSLPKATRPIGSSALQPAPSVQAGLFAPNQAQAGARTTAVCLAPKHFPG